MAAFQVINGLLRALAYGAGGGLVYDVSRRIDRGFGLRPSDVRRVGRASHASLVDVGPRVRRPYPGAGADDDDEDVQLRRRLDGLEAEILRGFRGPRDFVEPAYPSLEIESRPFQGELDPLRAARSERHPAGAGRALARRARFKEGDKDAVEAEMRGQDPSRGVKDDIEGGPSDDVPDVIVQAKEAVKRSSYRYVLGLVSPVPMPDDEPSASGAFRRPVDVEVGIAPVPFKPSPNLAWASGCCSQRFLLRNRAHGTTNNFVQPALAAYAVTVFDNIRNQAMAYRGLTFVSSTEDEQIGADTHPCRVPVSGSTYDTDSMRYYSQYFAPPPYVSHASRVPARLPGLDYPRAVYPTSRLQLWMTDGEERRTNVYQQSNARTGRAGETVTGKYIQINGVLCSGRFMYATPTGRSGARSVLNEREKLGQVAPYVDMMPDSDNPTFLGTTGCKTLTTLHRVIVVRKRARAAVAADYVGAGAHNYDMVGPVNVTAPGMSRFENSGGPIVRDFFAPIDMGVVGEMRVLYDKVFETDAETTAKHVGINIQIPEHESIFSFNDLPPDAVDRPGRTVAVGSHVCVVYMSYLPRVPFQRTQLRYSVPKADNQLVLYQVIPEGAVGTDDTAYNHANADYGPMPPYVQPGIFRFTSNFSYSDR